MQTKNSMEDNHSLSSWMVGEEKRNAQNQCHHDDIHVTLMSDYIRRQSHSSTWLDILDNAEFLGGCVISFFPFSFSPLPLHYPLLLTHSF